MSRVFLEANPSLRNSGGYACAPLEVWKVPKERYQTGKFGCGTFQGWFYSVGDAYFSDQVLMIITQEVITGEG